MFTHTDEDILEAELICGFSEKINGTVMRFTHEPMPGDKVDVQGRHMKITNRCWDHTVDPPVMKLEVHLDH